MTTNGDFLLLGDVSRLLNIKPYRITYALTSGLVGEPQLRIKGQRVFQTQDLDRLAQHFGVRLEEKDDARDEQPTGCWRHKMK